MLDVQGTDFPREESAFQISNYFVSIMGSFE